MNNTGIIVLAAGNSSRLGKPKQLLSFQHQSLIEHITSEALMANLFPIIIVTGAHAEMVSEILNNENIKIVFNAQWQQGMASSIITGLSNLLLINGGPEDVIIAVCDQPFVSAELFRQLRKKKAESNKGIVACSYGDTTGVPVLFAHDYFQSLLQLKGEEGAKRLLTLYKDDVATVSFPEGSIDIDTAEDYQRLSALDGISGIQ